jgi:hypothetical protein
VLTRTNKEDKADIRQKFIFVVPVAFETAPPYTCGTGGHLSEARITDVNGLVLSRTFELCPLIGFRTTAQIGS